MDITELGAQLRQQREHLGFSLQEVAESTKVSKRILVAFEEGDRDHFPHRVYAKGFVQSYAKVLGLDPREFGEAMEQALRPCDGAPAAPIRPEVCAPAARRGWGIWLLALLLAALLAFLVWYFFIRPAHPVALEGFTPESAVSAGAAPASAEAPAPPVEVVPAAEPSAPAAQPQAAAAAPADQASVQASAGAVAVEPPAADAPPADLAPFAAAPGAASGTAPGATPGVVPAAPPLSEPAPGHHVLRVTALDEKGSWVGIWLPGREDLDHDLLVRAFRTVDIDVPGLRRFKFGRVEGVTATFDGKPLDLGPAGTRTIHLPKEP